MSPARSFGYIVFYLLAAYSTRAQTFIRLHFHHVSPKSGLSSIYVRKIIQDPFGYMWVGTEDGLNRYEGRNFIVYNKGLQASRSLTGVDTRDLLLDTLHHTIWVITSFGGIDAIDYITGGIVYSYHQDSNKATSDIVFNSLSLAGDSLYIGSTNGLFVLNIRSRQLSKVPLANPFRQKNVGLSIDHLVRDQSGFLWLFCRDQGVLLLNDLLGIQDVAEGPALHELADCRVQFYDCTLLRDGTILSATSSGLKSFSRAGAWTGDAVLVGDRALAGGGARAGGGNIAVKNDPFPSIPAAQDREIYSCRQDKKGYIWFCTSGYLVRTDVSGNTFQLVKEHMSRDEFNWLDAVYDIFFDQDDNVWLGCQAGLAWSGNGASCFTGISRSSISETLIKHAYYINPVDDSVLYCCAQDGLYKVQTASGVIQPMDNTRPYYHAFYDPFGRLIISNIDGTFISANRIPVPLSRIYPEFRPLKELVFSSHCASGDSVIVFGTQNDRGIVVWNYKRRTARFIDQHTPETWLMENRVSAVYKDRKGLIWVLGDKSISMIDLTRRSAHSLNVYNHTQNKFYSLFFDVCEANGQFYVASYGAGVLVLDSNYRYTRELSAKDGLSANSVYKIMPYKDSLLFVTSNNGLSVVNVKNGYATKNYYGSDGLHSDNFEEFSGAIRNNIIYAGGANGLTAIDPALFNNNQQPPRVYVRQIKMERQSGSADTSNLLLNSLKIPNDVLQTTVYLSCINYSNPDRAFLAYRIKELNSGWNDIGTQDLIPLIGLNPGKYTLQVRAANEDGVWTRQPAEFRLEFLPKWYQTLWFKVGIGVVLLGLLYGVYLYRISQLQKQQQIRRDIASDLHDDLGSILNTVKIYTHLAQRDQNKEPHLSLIEESITQASSGLRDMLWVLDDSPDTVRELAERIKKFALPVTQVRKIHFDCVADDVIADQVLSKTLKRNLLLIAKEAINNSLKYSECRNIRVSLVRENDRLVFSIRDDGKGFDATDTIPGNGLKNIRQRAKQIRFFARITSTPGLGTVVEIVGG